MQTIAAQRRFALLFGIARMTQLRRNLRDGQLRSDLHHLRSSENLSRTGKYRAAETLLDDAVVLHIPVGKKTDHQERQREKTKQGNPYDGIAGEQAALPAASPPLGSASGRRYFQLNGHGDNCSS